MPPPKLVAAVQATSAIAEFAGVGWDTTRALMPFSNEFANILVQSSLAPEAMYSHGGHGEPSLVTTLSTNAFDLLALTGIMLNVVQSTSLYGQTKGMRVGLIVAFLAFVVPNALLGPLTDVVVGCTLGNCPGAMVGGKLVKVGRLVAGWSLVWVLESGIELAKEMACHPANVHEHLKALLPLSAAVGWTTALHLGLRHGKALVGRTRSAFASAASTLQQPKQSPTPSSPTPTPEKAAAKAAAAAAEREAEPDADAPSAEGEAAEAEAEAAVDEPE